MFDVGFPELVLVFVIALLVLGPQRLPKVAAEVGRWVGRARRTATQLRRQLEREIELAEIEPPKPPPRPSTPEPQAPGDETRGESAGAADSPESGSATAEPFSDALSDHAAGVGASTPAEEATEKSPPA